MTPEEVAASYNQIARQWVDVSTYGFAQVERAIAFVKRKAVALDVGCGTGRLMGLLGNHGFRTDGIDVSPAMLALARDRHPDARLFHADIGRWDLPRPYDLIVAWDSVWHVPLAGQEGVLTKLCRGLAAGGVLIFTLGGTDGPDEKRDSYMGPPMYHASLGVPRTLELLAGAGCLCRHLEYDQYPEAHVYVIAQKPEGDDPKFADRVRLRPVEPGDLPRMFDLQLDPDSNRIRDAAVLAELGRRTFHETFAAHNKPEDMDAYTAEAFTVGRIAAEIGEPGAVYLVAETPPTVIGFARLAPEPSPPCITTPAPVRLVKLYVSADAIGSGVGAALMRAGVEWARNAGHGSLWLGVWEHNHRARAFYERWGFAPVGTESFRLGTDDQTDVLMQLVLGERGG